MYTLIIDTSHSLLVVGLAKDGYLIDYSQEVLSKKHSELLILRIDEVIKRNQCQISDIKSIVVTDGPGSYTGMRIGLTFAKVFSIVNDVRVYTVDTLLSLIGNQTGFAFIDARSRRIFGAYSEDGVISDEKVYSIDDLHYEKVPLFGDVHLIGNHVDYGNIAQNILNVEKSWKFVENADLLVPRYLS